MIKNIIFDFGGVLLDIDYRITLKKLEKLTGIDFKNDVERNWFLDLFRSFEKGEISDLEFVSSLQIKSKLNPSAEKLKAAWNAMLLRISPDVFPFLLGLQDQFRVFLLSNTNGIHLDYVVNMLHETHKVFDFDSSYFEKTYYSHLIGMRKPDSDIFDFVVAENRLIKQESLFIDDLPHNIDGAKKSGLHAIQHNPKTKIIDVFSSYVASFG